MGCPKNSMTRQGADFYKQEKQKKFFTDIYVSASVGRTALHRQDGPGTNQYLVHPSSSVQPQCSVNVFIPSINALGFG